LPCKDIYENGFFWVSNSRIMIECGHCFCYLGNMCKIVKVLLVQVSHSTILIVNFILSIEIYFEVSEYETFGIIRKYTRRPQT